MKALKKVITVLVVIIAVAVIAAFFLPGKVYVERSIVVNASPEVVFEQVNTLKNWEKWSPWHKKDPNMKIQYEGAESGVGASYKWESNHEEVGNGSLKITASAPYDSVVTALDFMENGTGIGGYRFKKEGDGTKLTWYMEADMGMNPVARYIGLMMDGMLGPDFEEGLKSIKQVAESMPKEPEVKIEAVTLNRQDVLAIKDSCAADAISAKLGELYGEIQAAMGKGGANQAGPVFSIYYTYSPEKVVLEAGIPVDKVITPDAKGRVKAAEIAAGNAVLGHHYGPYDSSAKTHGLMDEWIKKNSKTVIGAPWEVYITDPGKEPDPNKWYTQVYYPVQ